MNNIIVISGPSGSGKSTLIRLLLKKHRDIVFSVSHTTRPRRPREVEGIDYYFVSQDQFRRMIDDNAFAEWAEVHNNYYGTTIEEIDNKSGNPGKVLVLDVDFQGAGNIKKKFPEAVLILVTPSSAAELKRRLLKREKKVDQHIKKRLRMAKEELKQYKLYDYIVINDNLDRAFSLLNSIYTAFKNTTARNEARIKRIIELS